MLTQNQRAPLTQDQHLSDVLTQDQRFEKRQLAKHVEVLTLVQRLLILVRGLLILMQMPLTERQQGC